jgi:hypothetical protein
MSESAATFWLVWFGVGFIVSLIYLVAAWYDNHDTTIAEFINAIFWATILGPIALFILFFVWIESFGSRVLIKGRKRSQK